MQYHSLHGFILALLFLIAPSAATFGIFAWTDCITNWNWDSHKEHGGGNNKNPTTTKGSTPTANCAVPSIVVASKKKREDDDELIRLDKKFAGSYYPKAALGVSKVTKKEDGLYEVVCNFQAANSGYLKQTVPNNKVKKLTFSNTGCGSDFSSFKVRTARFSRGPSGVPRLLSGQKRTMASAACLPA